MTIEQEIAELRAELSGSILTRRERAEIKIVLEQAMHRRDRLEDEAELLMLSVLEGDGFSVDPGVDDVRHARELALA